MKKYEAPEVIVLDVNGSEIFTSADLDDTPPVTIPGGQWG